MRDELFQRLLQSLADARDVDYLQLLAHVVGDVLGVGLVARGQHDAPQPRAVRRQDLLLDAADGEDQTRERDLARHRRVVAHAAAGHQGGEAGRDGDARRRAVLRDGARRDVDVDAVVLEQLRVEPELGGVRPEVRARRARRLLHHLAELSGQLQPTASGQQRRLDEEELAARLRPSHAGRHAGRQLLARLLGVEARRAEQLLQVAGVHANPLRLPFGDAQRGLAREAADGALQLPDARLARVARGDERERGVRYLELAFGESVLARLARDEVLPRDVHLLLIAVAAQADYLHAVAQRAGYRRELVGRRDEEDLRQIEREV